MQLDLCCGFQGIYVEAGLLGCGGDVFVRVAGGRDGGG